MSENPNVEVYDPSKVAGEEYDAIVIGSGIGGLSVASLLAQADKKVIVLEQNNVAGGACSTFTSNGYEFGPGIHYVGEMHDGSEFKDILDSLTPADDPIEWDRMDDNYETVFIGDPPAQYNMVAGEKALKRMLVEHFPEEKKAIDEYFKFAKKVKSLSRKRWVILKSLPLPLARFLIRTGLCRLVIGAYRKWTKRSVQKMLAKLTNNKDLQALLASNYPDFGTEPSRAPSWAQPVILTHFLEGAYYPRGGPSNIPKKVIGAISDNKGKIYVSALVKCILVDENSGKASGVEMVDGSKIKSNTVISDAGLVNTATKLLPHGLVNIDFADVGAKDANMHFSATGVSIYVGLNGDAESLKLPKGIVWIHASNDLSGTAQKLRDLPLEQALELDPKELSPIGVAFPCTKDSTWNTRYPNKCTIEVVTWLPWHWFEKFASTFDKESKSHGSEYEAAKVCIAEKIWDRVVQVLEPTGAKLPKTLDDADHFNVATPFTFERYLMCEHGAYYGLDIDIKRTKPETYFLRLRPEMPEVPGLYLTGQDIVSDGLVFAMMGGLLCAMKVLGVANPETLLRSIKKKAKEQVKDEDKPAAKIEQALPAQESTE